MGALSARVSDPAEAPTEGLLFALVGFFCHVGLQWHHDGFYRQFRIEDGMFLRVRLSQCQLPEDGKIWYEIEWQKGSLLHRIRRARNIEPIGFAVERKRWIPDFEYAEGDFWPPLQRVRRGAPARAEAADRTDYLV